MHRGFTPQGLVALLCSTLAFTATSISAHAASISKVTGDKVIVEFAEGEDISEGSRYLVMIGGKKKAVVEVTKVKGTKAAGKVLKGNAAVGGELTPLAASTKKSGGDQAATKKRSRRSNSGLFNDMTYGAVGGVDMATQEVTASGVTISQTGMGFSVKGFGDLPISGPLGMIGRVGLTQFSVKGSMSGTDYKTDILYATADLMLRYNFGESGFVPYVLGGLGLHFPLSKSSNVLDTQRISATTIFFGGGGFHYTLSDTSYITTSFEYGMFPPSNDVKTSMISVRTGLGWTL